MKPHHLTLTARLLCMALLACFLPACHQDQFFGSIDWFVDPGFGDDLHFDGSPDFPFRSITRALQFAISGDAIFLAPGTYDTFTGEVFPIRVSPGVLVQGDPATKGVGPLATFVTGGGVYSVGGGSQIGPTVTPAFVMGDGSSLSGVKITVAGTNGVGVVFDGTSASLFSCTITGNGGSGIRVYQIGSPSISANVITANGGSGIEVFDTGGPNFRGNLITSNGVDGVTANNASVPNLGDAVSAGGNTIQGNTGFGLNNNTTSSTLQAAGNTWNDSQNSTPSGNYPTLFQPGPAPPPAGNNFAITNAAAAIQF